MGGLRQDTSFFQQQAKLPCSSILLTLALVDDDRIEQSSSSDRGHKFRVCARDGATEDLPETVGASS